MSTCKKKVSSIQLKVSKKEREGQNHLTFRYTLIDGTATPRGAGAHPHNTGHFRCPAAWLDTRGQTLAAQILATAIPRVPTDWQLIGVGGTLHGLRRADNLTAVGT